MKKSIIWKPVVLLGLALLFLTGLMFLLAAPSGQAQAAPAPQGSPADACKNCHTEVYDRWSQSKHGAAATNCFACHQLEQGEGAHPQLNYLNLPEAETCDVCHANIKADWTASKHGERGMGCITCHEPHSQKQKLIGENKTTCENCHRTQLEATHTSTHGAAGVTCFDCHMGPQVGHTFISQISTCQTCHSDIHQANSLVRGAFITPVAPDVKPRVVEPSQPQRGGVNLPTWLFFLVGIGVGGGAVWVLIERELDVNNGNGKTAPKQESSEAQNETQANQQ
ncbi:MAG: hypothetical protein N2117_13045 [Anaerolineales bacterium]|nr:hypothetical protein [Anaerolineales bacterium]MCX7756150.1 hypothetical protein [Anaerolineales bacterium]MDW8277632.1 multiheme c-type cytochrome [Anaerolineales bacterium]